MPGRITMRERAAKKLSRFTPLQSIREKHFARKALRHYDDLGKIMLARFRDPREAMHAIELLQDIWLVRGRRNPKAEDEFEKYIEIHKTPSLARTMFERNQRLDEALAKMRAKRSKQARKPTHDKK